MIRDVGRILYRTILVDLAVVGVAIVVLARLKIVNWGSGISAKLFARVIFPTVNYDRDPLLTLLLFFWTDEVLLAVLPPCYTVGLDMQLHVLLLLAWLVLIFVYDWEVVDFRVHIRLSVIYIYLYKL